MGFIRTFVVSVLTFACAISQAAIIGLLSEGPNTKLKVEIQNGELTLTINSAADFGTLYLTQQLGSDGGSVEKMLAALTAGKPFPPNMLEAWLPADEGPATFKVGIFTDGQRMSYESAFTGQTVHLFYFPLERFSQSAPDSEGSMEQIYKTSVKHLALFTLETKELRKYGKEGKDIALVIQYRKPGDTDVTLRSIAIPRTVSDTNMVVYSTDACGGML